MSTHKEEDPLDGEAEALLSLEISERGIRRISIYADP